jgi:hypothetical protein
LQQWRAVTVEELVAQKLRNEEVVHTESHDAFAQTEPTDNTRCKSGVEIAPEDTALAPTVVGAPPTVPGGILRALQGEQVWLDMESGEIYGAALWLSQKPPQASRSFVRTFDICLPWMEAHAPPGSEAPSSSPTLDPLLLENGSPTGSLIRAEPLSLPASPAVGTRSPLSRSPMGGCYMARSVASTCEGRRVSREEKLDELEESVQAAQQTNLHASREKSASAKAIEEEGDDVLTPEKVLRRISGLMSEMTAMEDSLGNLREELDSAPLKAGKGIVQAAKSGKEVSHCEVHSISNLSTSTRRVPLRVRQRSLAAMSWAQAGRRPVRALTTSPSPVARHTPRAQARNTGPRVSLDARHSSSRGVNLRGRPPLYVAARAGQPKDPVVADPIWHPPL